MRRTRITLVAAFWLALLPICVVACVGPDQKPPDRTDGQLTTSAPNGSTSATGGSATGETASGDAAPGATSIPQGRAFAEGGGGPESYTFREEWRRAVETASQWRSGAFLVTASGRNVNTDGVPSSWTMMFVDAIPTDEILFIEIDPWGKVTAKRTVDTAKVFDLLQPGDARIPFGVADSDVAVAKSVAALTAGGGSRGGNATLTLAFARDHTGPYWTYMAEGPGSKRSVVRVEAMTGQTKVVSP